MTRNCTFMLSTLTFSGMISSVLLPYYCLRYGWDEGTTRFRQTTVFVAERIRKPFLIIVITLTIQYACS